MYHEIKTDRLKIRPICLEDGQFMLELVNTQGWLMYIGDRNVHSVKDAEQYIQRMLDNPVYFYHVIEQKESIRPVGVVSFLKRDNQQYYDIGFALLPEFQGKGIAFEACSAYLLTVQANHVFENIIAISLPHNIKSIALLEKLGFKLHNVFQQGDDLLSLYRLKTNL
jgi:ribosomal-protein-alanine N-acetyltransferase